MVAPTANAGDIELVECNTSHIGGYGNEPLHKDLKMDRRKRALFILFATKALRPQPLIYMQYADLF